MLCLEQCVDDLGVQDGAAGRHLADGAQEPLGIAETLLQQVGQALGAVSEELERVLRVVVLGEHHDPEVRVLGPQLEGEVDALGREARGHADVEQDHVGAVAGPQPAQLVG